LKEEMGVSDKGFLAIVVATVGKRIANSPECKTATTRVEQVPQNDVFDVLCSDTSSTKHGKSGLHEVDECTLKDRQRFSLVQKLGTCHFHF
jgi:hypothetical protein